MRLPDKSTVLGQQVSIAEWSSCSGCYTRTCPSLVQTMATVMQSGTPLSVQKQESKSFTSSSSSRNLERSRSAVDSKSEGKRAHGGSVICMAAHSMRVWTSGGSSSSYNLREWSSAGQHLASFDLPLLGTHGLCILRAWLSRICIVKAMVME